MMEKILEGLKENYENLKFSYNYLTDRNMETNIAPDSGMIDIKFAKYKQYPTVNSLMNIAGSEYGLDFLERMVQQMERFEFRCYYFLIELILR